jgi:hypothetical protein
MKKRRALLLFAVAAIMITVVVLAAPTKNNLLLLEWAGKSSAEAPPVYVLIEMGLKDQTPHKWDSKATVSGARVVKREGYRFRPADKLVGAEAWEASSHWAVALPAGQARAAAAATERIATVGVVLHLADVKPDGRLTVQPRPEWPGKAAVVALKDVLAGKPEKLWGGEAVVRRLTSATPLTAGKTEDDFPAAAYGPDGTLWVAYIAYTVRDEGRRVEQKPLKEQPADFKKFYVPEFGDQLFVQYYRDGAWSKPKAVTGAAEDLVRCAVGVAGNGDAWVVYSANRAGNYDLYARRLDRNTPEAVKNPAPRVGEEVRLTKGSAPDLGPVLCTAGDGTLWLAAQSWDEAGTANISLFRCKDGKWGDGPALSAPKKAENRWAPALAAGPDGKVALAYDVYRDGDYDVVAATIDGERVTEQAVAASAKFEARPSLAFDAAGRLWIAYEEGPERWGKDYGALVPRAGDPLYSSRSVRVVCLADGRLLAAPDLPTSPVKKPIYPYSDQEGPRYERGTRFSNPRLGLDGKGRLWLTYRQKFGTRYTTHPGSYWLTFARRLDGDRWTEAVEVHHSDGLLDQRPVLLPHAGGGVVIIHNTDGRHTTPEMVGNQIYTSVLDLPGEPLDPKLQPHEPGRKDEKRADEERAAIQRIRDYRMDIDGKKYQYLRGEYHRHTEISWDGGPDGSLEDMFRYAIDCAGMDWIGNGDHDNGAGREYSWWLVQKFSDAYHVAKVFTPMFTYERSVSYPHGHRNVMFARRGILTLPRLAEPDMDKRVGGVHADDTKMLYRYLRELDGICAVHTSATNMGTDWRDNDPKVEPIVEIYQGDRMSYEKEESPRAGYDPKSDVEPANIAGWFPDGFIDHALDKGYRLGFQSSSDHWSTHISYFIVLAETHDRAGILEAVKRRHVYGATDDVILDVRSGTHMMGDEFTTNAAPVLQFHVIGTQPIARIDVLKDSEVVETIKPGKREHKGEWTDPRPGKGVHHYYLRVLQQDEQLAWGSPMWIDYKP